MPGRAAIYTRLSKDRAEERSREDQEADCRALCALKGFNVVALHTDLESGYRRNARRAGYDALLDDLRAGAVDVVVIWKLDRLTRQGIRQIAPLLDVLEACNATLLSVHDPIDTSSAMGEGVLGMLASMAKQESENMSVRIRRSKRHHAEAGRHRDGGLRPFGLSGDWSELVPEEAALIREAAARVLAAESLRSIVLDWRARGIPTSTGGQWLTTSLRTLLLQPRLYGARVHAGRVVARGTWPTILDEATCARLRAVLTDPARRPGPPVHAYLLTGFLRCERCGARMRSAQPKGAKRAYQCPGQPEGCARVSIIGEETEQEVITQVLAAVASPAPPKQPSADPSTAALLAAIADDEAQLEELARDWAARAISRAEWLVARAGVQARIDTAHERLAVTAVSLPASVAELPARWEGLTFDQRRASLRAVIDRVEIGPAPTRGRNRFDPLRIRVIWRD